MTIDEGKRHRLHQRLGEVLGPDDATTLMERLPPAGWADVATKDDVAALGVELRGEMARLGGELRLEIAGLRTEVHDEIAGLRTEVHGEIAGLRTEVHDEIAGLRTEMHRELHALTWRFVTALVTAMVAFGGVVIAAVKL
jgi:hypothetical protein